MSAQNKPETRPTKVPRKKDELVPNIPQPMPPQPPGDRDKRDPIRRDPDETDQGQT